MSPVFQISVQSLYNLIRQVPLVVFTLKVLGELNYKEIAQIFGKQETWARVTYHRARVKIQDILERRST